LRARGAAISGLSRAKASPGDPAAMESMAATQGQLNGALGRLLAGAEAYPDSRQPEHDAAHRGADVDRKQGRLSHGRRSTTASWRYNNRREVFPSSVVAGMFNFAPRPCWKSGEQQAQVRAAPKVQF
jgi:LemA protein